VGTKVALITGGGTGIGRAVALRLSARGCRCVIIYSRSEREAEETVQAIQTAGGEALAIRADVSDQEAVDAMVSVALDSYGRIDYLVNSAGRTAFVPMEDLEGVTDEHWDSILGVNVLGNFRVTRACAAQLRANHGAVVNLASIAGAMGRGSSIPYCVSKAGIESLTKAFARVLAPEVRVNAVAPGIVETRWVAGHEDHVQLQTEGTLLKRVCQADDVAELIVALIFDAGFVTGQTVTVDGGFTL
jgi:3-oxoacyl-[acyl-carrier protein] reductase